MQSTAVVSKERSASQNNAQAQLQNYWSYCVLEGSAEQSIVFTMFQKAQMSKTWYSLCWRGPRRAKYSIHCVFEGSGEQSMVFTVFEKAQPIKV